MAAFSMGPLQDDALSGLELGHVDGFVQQRLVGDDLFDLDAAGGADDGLGLGVVDAHRQFLGGEPAEDHRVHRPDAGAGQHGYHGRFGIMGM
jgi:hypothetical protein